MARFRTHKFAVRASACLKAFCTFAIDECGASIVAIALSMPVLIGGMGLAAEISYWRLHHRAMQNAADSAAIAAATNNSSNYVDEAQSVATQYGFPNGSGQITVAVANPATAAGCTANCYTVAISDNLPLFFSQIVGYSAADVVAKAQAVLSESELLRAMFDVGYFPPNTPQ